MTTVKTLCVFVFHYQMVYAGIVIRLLGIERKSRFSGTDYVSRLKEKEEGI